MLIDCQPSLGLLTLNALTASTEVIIPMETEYFALRGVALLKDTIDKVVSRLNPELRILGVLPTMYNSHTGTVVRYLTGPQLSVTRCFPRPLIGP